MRLYGAPGGSPERWLAGLSAELAEEEASGRSPLASAVRSLGRLGVPASEWEGFVARTLLALRGPLLPALRKGDLDLAVVHTQQHPHVDITQEIVREELSADIKSLLDLLDRRETITRMDDPAACAARLARPANDRSGT